MVKRDKTTPPDLLPPGGELKPRRKVTLLEMAAEASVELEMRTRVYAGRVEAGKMKQPEMERKLALMAQIRDTMFFLDEHSDFVRRALRLRSKVRGFLAGEDDPEFVADCFEHRAHVLEMLAILKVDGDKP